MNLLIVVILNNFLYCILKANFYWFTNYFHLRWSSHFNLYFQYVTCVPMTHVKMVRHVTIHQDLTPVSVKMVGMEAIVQKVNILLILDFRSFIDPIGLGLRLYGVECNFQQYFSYIVVISFIVGGSRSTRRKLPTCRNSLTYWPQ